MVSKENAPEVVIIQVMPLKMIIPITTDGASVWEDHGQDLAAKGADQEGVL